jgi:hypothetical protein
VTTPRPRTRSFSQITALALLLALGITGVWGAVDSWAGAVTRGQRAANIAQLAYGILGLLAGLGLWTGRAWIQPVLLVWIGCVTIASGLAPVVWGGSETSVGVLSAVSGFLIAVAVWWLARR